MDTQHDYCASSSYTFLDLVILPTAAHGSTEGKQITSQRVHAFQFKDVINSTHDECAT